MPLPNKFEDAAFLNRDVSGAFEEELYMAADIHDRMRSVGIQVVQYEIAIEGTNKYLRPDYVTGESLEDMDTPTYRRELGKLALGLHRFYAEAVEDNVPYVLFDSMGIRQYMYGTTEAQTEPTTQLVDIEPFLMSFSEALEKPDSSKAAVLHDELNGMREWAEPYWEAAGLPDFAVPRQSEEQRRAHMQRIFAQE